MTPAPERSPRAFKEWYLGDIVRVYASSNLRSPISGPQRIYGMPVDISDNGLEKITQMIVASDEYSAPAVDSFGGGGINSQTAVFNNARGVRARCGHPPSSRRSRGVTDAADPGHSAHADQSPQPLDRQGEHGAMLGLLGNQAPRVQFLTTPVEPYLLWCNGTGGGRAHPSPSTYVIDWSGVIINSQFSIVELTVTATGAVGGTLGTLGDAYIVQMPQGLLLGAQGIGRWTDFGTGVNTSAWAEYNPGTFPFGFSTQPFFPAGVSIRLADGTFARPGTPKVWAAGDTIFKGTLTGTCSMVETAIPTDDTNGFLVEWDPNKDATLPYFAQTEDA